MKIARFCVVVLTTLCIHLFSYAQVNLTQGLVAYYPFNGNANDASGNGNNPTFNNATPAADRTGAPNSAYAFNGIDNCMRIPNAPSLNMNTAMSIAVYVKVSGFYQGTCHGNAIINKSDNDYVPGQYGLRFDDNVYTSGGNCSSPVVDQTHQTFYAPGIGGVAAPNNYVQKDTWYCLVFTNDGITSKIYIDGVLNNSQPSATGTFSNSYDLYLGRMNHPTFPYWFNGTMDDLRIYNRALNLQEVQALCLTTTQPATVTPSFTAPDTICINNPVNITNTTVGASSYYWSFCSTNLNNPPIGTNLGNIGGVFNSPVYIDYVLDNGNYYGFTTNNYNGHVIRMDFGNSLLNTPTTTDLGNFGGGIAIGTEGIQVVKNEGKWYALIVGGGVTASPANYLIKLEFGTSITNPTPTLTNWGNLGNLAYAHDLYVFNDGNIWYGLTVNYSNHTITRFDFTNSFSNTPTAVNLGNISGSLNYPTGIYAIKDNGNWHAFVTNAGNNTISRLDFGSSLLNTPTGQNLGNLGNKLHTVWDITFIRYCGELLAYAINADGNYNELVKLDFQNNVTNSNPAVTVLGNLGSMNFPHCISKLFRVGADLYAFVPNVLNQSITRLQFAGCTNASLPSSTAQNPPPISYNMPGTYNITLTVDDGLPTQATFCKPVVVLPAPVSAPTVQKTACTGKTVRIGTGNAGAQFLWNTGATTDSIDVSTTGKYWVDINSFGCTATDTFEVNINSCIVNASFTAPDTICINNSVNITNTSIGATSYYWNFCVGNLNNAPIGANLGNINGAMSGPVYVDYVSDNGNYYGFVTDNYTGNLLRLDFGNSLLNTPVLTNLGTLGGKLKISNEGIQVIKNEGKWYAIIVGGEPAIGVQPYITKVEFGANIANANPVATDWGNLGNMQYPHDLYVFNDASNHWYGLTVNTNNNTITRFDFTNSFSNTPTAVNIGNIGNLNAPTGIHAILDNGNWYAFITNAGSSSITRLDFGNSLLNIPTGVNIGNPGNIFNNKPWDIQVIKFCGQILAFVIDASTASLVKLDFNNNITNNTPSAVNFGNIGNMQFPHCLSRIFRAGADLYTFVPNVQNSTITRIQFAGCTNASIPNSTVENPPAIKYNVPGTYNINLTIDDGLPTQSVYCKQVVVLPAPVPAPTVERSICTAQTIRIGTGNKTGTYLWNTGATTDSIDVNTVGTYWVETNSFGCKATDTFKIAQSNVSDFSFKQDVCNPTNVQFLYAGTGATSPYWDLGDGTIITGNFAPGHTYPALGDYIVRFSVQQGICSDTVSKKISISVIKDDIITTLDTTICDGTTKQLRSKASLNFCWSPTTYLDNPLSPTPITNTPQNITYYLTAEVPGSNLITNGDFSAGNTGFKTDYVYAPNNTTEGEYFIGTNPQAWNASLSNCTDHTSGNGNMLLVNGSPIADMTVWKQTIPVTPNTNYAFSSWLQALYPPNPAQLSFSINGTDIGTPLTAALPTCTWKQFYTIWNSGNSTTATISIINKNTIVQGNDFALDDISFAPLLIKRDSVVINVEKPVVKTGNDTTVCAKSPVPLFATGAAQYAWTPQTGLSSPANASPVATPEANTQYIVTGTTIHGCVAKDTIQVNVFAKPAIARTGDTAICQHSSFQLFASGGQSYSWTPATGLSNPGIANPVATIGKDKVTYTVKITDVHSCDYVESINLSVRPYPVFSASGSKFICYGDVTPLTASGGTNYQWSPANMVANPSAASTTTSPTVTTQYSVHIEESVCHFDTTINMQVIVNPVPEITVNKANDINCNTPSAQLNASGGLVYSWAPIAGLDDPTKSNPVSTTDSSTLYVVTGTNQFGCSTKASVPVIVTKDGIPRFVVPNAFTPNGDGNNDCFGIKRWGNAQITEFSIFNRWGQLVFKTNNPANCWDGTLHGKPQDSGGYVYIIKARTLCGEVTRKGIVMLIR